MTTITTTQQLDAYYNRDELAIARATLRERSGVEPYFWMVREQIRMFDGTYEAVSVPNDDPMRFLHKSTSGDGRVAYTKNADKGARDIQTVTTLEAYCRKFGLTMPSAVEPVPASAPAPTADVDADVKPCGTNPACDVQVTAENSSTMLSGSDAELVALFLDYADILVKRHETKQALLKLLSA